MSASPHGILLMRHAAWYVMAVLMMDKGSSNYKSPGAAVSDETSSPNAIPQFVSSTISIYAV